MIALGFVYAQLGFHYMSALDQRCRRAPARMRMRININWIKNILVNSKTCIHGSAWTIKAKYYLYNYCKN